MHAHMCTCTRTCTCKLRSPFQDTSGTILDAMAETPSSSSKGGNSEQDAGVLPSCMGAFVLRACMQACMRALTHGLSYACMHMYTLYMHPHLEDEGAG